MNVSYKGEALTTDFEQTNRWITSFTPRVQSPNVDHLDVHLKVAFAGKWRHKDLMKPFYLEWNPKVEDGNGDGLSWVPTVYKPLRFWGHCDCEHPVLCTCWFLPPCRMYTDDYEFYIHY